MEEETNMARATTATCLTLPAPPAARSLLLRRLLAPAAPAAPAAPLRQYRTSRTCSFCCAGPLQPQLRHGTGEGLFPY